MENVPKSLCCLPEHRWRKLSAAQRRKGWLQTSAEIQQPLAATQLFLADLCKVWAHLRGGTAWGSVMNPAECEGRWVHVGTTQGATLRLYLQYQQEVRGLWASWSEAGDTGSTRPMLSVHRSIKKINKVTQIPPRSKSRTWFQGNRRPDSLHL